MNKKIFIFSALIFGIITLSGCSKNTNQQSTKASADSLKPKAEKIEVINFHATQRCVSCSTLGNFTEATIYEFFQPELRDGLIEFKSINVDLPENKEMAKKYQAVGSSLFINSIYDGQDHIEEDVRVWRLLGSEQQFKSYLKNKIDGLLNK
ncbi:hypothetical protein EOL94_00235 [bacterium]|nr:hypothetical protein [bacterium]